MGSVDENSMKESISDLELVHWADEDHSMRGIAKKEGIPVESMYETYQSLYDARLDNGPLVIASPVVDVIFIAESGEFDGHIVAVRQSGRNVRRFLIRKDIFEEQYGTFQGCLNHVRSNNAVDSAIELEHLHDLGKKLNLSPTEIDPSRDYNRLEVDIVAALQLTQLLKENLADDSASSQAFELGFCVGRLFSSAQNYATLEPDANRAKEYEKSYQERGRKGKSKDRKSRRLSQLFECLTGLMKENPGFSRLKPIEVAKLAIIDASNQNPNLWSQGRGQIEHYLSCFASDDNFREAYRTLFPETG